MEKWRLIVERGASGALNMATDEALLTVAEAGEGGRFTPTIRLYEWEEPTLTIGYLQKSGPFAECGVPFLRRITGGRAVLHDKEITYSIVCHSSHRLFVDGISEAYAVISGCIRKALGDVGIEASGAGALKTRPQIGARRAEAKKSCFHAPARHELLVSGRKLVGSAQRRQKGAFLQHGSILLDVDAKLVGRIFGSDALGTMAWMNEFREVDSEEFKKALIRRFQEGFGADINPGPLTEQESELKKTISQRRYSNPEWNFRGKEVCEDIRITGRNTAAQHGNDAAHILSI